HEAPRWYSSLIFREPSFQAATRSSVENFFGVYSIFRRLASGRRSGPSSTYSVASSRTRILFLLCWNSQSYRPYGAICPSRPLSPACKDRILATSSPQPLTRISVLPSWGHSLLEVSAG